MKQTRRENLLVCAPSMPRVNCCSQAIYCCWRSTLVFFLLGRRSVPIFSYFFFSLLLFLLLCIRFVILRDFKVKSIRYFSRSIALKSILIRNQFLGCCRHFLLLCIDWPFQILKSKWFSEFSLEWNSIQTSLFSANRISIFLSACKINKKMIRQKRFDWRFADR